ncbi:MAG: CAP domain-containing protein [Chloroflexi bacterium]|nr:CAP domain-containing protein [Chloroflexota bacterium]
MARLRWRFWGKAVLVLSLVAALSLEAVPALAQPLPPAVLSYQDTQGKSGSKTLPVPLFIGEGVAESNPASFAQRVVELTNEARVAAGLAPLKVEVSLQAAAQGHAQDMADQDFVSHVGSNGSSLSQRLRNAGFTGWLIASENVAAGFSSPEAVVQAWLSSPGHRNNLLHPSLREIGVAYVHDPADAYGPFNHYWVQVFACRRKVYPVIINNEQASTSQPEVQLYLHGNGWASEMMVSNWADFHDAAWQPHQTTLAWSLEAGGGERAVYLRLRDKTGATVEATDAIFLEGDISSWSSDTPTATPQPSRKPTPTPPPFRFPSPSVTINGGASSTDSPEVTLQLRALPNTAWVAVSDSTDFTAATWVPFAPTLPWTLEEPGQTTLYVQFRTEADQVWGPVSASIEYLP